MKLSTMRPAAHNSRRAMRQAEIPPACEQRTELRHPEEAFAPSNRFGYGLSPRPSQWGRHHDDFDRFLLACGLLTRRL